MKVRLSRAARADRLNARRYYARESPAAALRFAEELAHALNYIADYPEGAPIIWSPVHAKTLRDFPYSVLYVVEGTEIRVSAIAHHAQDPATFYNRR